MLAVWLVIPFYLLTYLLTFTHSVLTSKEPVAVPLGRLRMTSNTLTLR